MRALVARLAAAHHPGCSLAASASAHHVRAPPGSAASMEQPLSTSTAASTAAHAPSALTYAAPGEPLDVLQLAPGAQSAEALAAQLQPDQIYVQMLLAAINPSDINTVQGKYPIQPPSLPGVPGHEGVGRVAAVGAQVRGVRAGDLVVPLQPAQGTWRQGGAFAAAAWHRVPPNLPLDQAATLCINPPSALGMLEQFVELHPGDVVVQNGGTSAVGQLVTQLARVKGLKTVSVIRERPDMQQTVARLKALGADLVTTDGKLKEDLKAAKLGPPPKLGLNCVGGQSALAVCKVLAEGGTLVTYGGMSLQPVTVPTSLLIFKDLSFRGFWLSGRFAHQQGPEGRRAMLDHLAQLILDGKIHTKTQSFPLRQWQDAVREATAGRREAGKVLLDLTQA